MKRRGANWGALVAGVLGLLLAAGCGPTVGDLPLPGSTVPGETIEIQLRFDDALNLAQGAAVKVNGVDAGRVQTVVTEDFKAIAHVEVRESALVRRSATARLRYTTPLGELFVDVSNPARGPLLEDGDVLDPEQATTAPTVEDTLASASLLINGGGLAQLQSVTSELNDALVGREYEVRNLLRNADRFLRTANATSADFFRALDSLAALSKTLRDNQHVIDAALRDLAPAARTLRENTPALTRLLVEVDELARTADGVVQATRADLLTMLRQVSPVLDEFIANRDLLGPSLAALVRVGEMIDGFVPGDYANLLLHLRMEGLRLPEGPGGGG